MKMLHVSDPHVGADGGADALAASARLAASEGRILCVTGDITDGGTQAEFEAARDALLPALKTGCRVVPGNHDLYGLSGIGMRSDSKWSAFLEVFHPFLGTPLDRRSVFPRYWRDHGDVWTVALDTCWGAGLWAGGGLQSGTNDALCALAEDVKKSEGTLVLLMHHHPVEYGESGPVPFLEWFAPVLGPQLAMDENSRAQLFAATAGAKCIMLHGHKHLEFAKYARRAGGRARVVGAPSLHPKKAPGGLLMPKPCCYNVDVRGRRFHVAGRSLHVPGWSEWSEVAVRVNRSASGAVRVAVSGRLSTGGLKRPRISVSLHHGNWRDFRGVDRGVHSSTDRYMSVSPSEGLFRVEVDLRDKRPTPVRARSLGVAVHIRLGSSAEILHRSFVPSGKSTSSVRHYFDRNGLRLHL